jgi:hypothetical protein
MRLWVKTLFRANETWSLLEQPDFHWRNFAKKRTLKNKKFGNIVILLGRGDSIVRTEKKKFLYSKNSQNFYIWFSVISHNYRKLIIDLCFISVL